MNDKHTEQPPDRVWLALREISGHPTWVQASGHDDGEYEYVRAAVTAPRKDCRHEYKKFSGLKEGVEWCAVCWDGGDGKIKHADDPIHASVAAPQGDGYNLTITDLMAGSCAVGRLDCSLVEFVYGVKYFIDEESRSISVHMIAFLNAGNTLPVWGNVNGCNVSSKTLIMNRLGI